MASLESLNFDNLALRTLPLDKEQANFVREVRDACFSRVLPAPVKNPRVIAYSPEALALLDLPESECRRGDFAKYFSGSAVLPGAEPAAHCYCGFQFGYFSGQLGDGAAMYLGEVINQAGERCELQLKGAGKTPFSRTADGRKVLRSSVREFLCSEAMFNLGIPTTRSGSCVTSDSYVTRDIFYTGNNIQERCTVISRIAPTFIRFGSFEIFKGIDNETGRRGPSFGRPDILKVLVDYTIKTFYPEIWEQFTDPEERALQFFREVVRRTALLVARWQCVGFCHGVLNTDNMSIVGVTLDYGPFGFMDRQPEICKWNCGKLAEALIPVLSLEKSTNALKEFDVEFEQEYSKLMHFKFGLHIVYPDDGKLFEDFLDTMYQTGADFTNSFRCLSRFQSEFDLDSVCDYLLEQCCSAREYKAAFRPQMDPSKLQMLLLLKQSNPDLLAMLGKEASAIDREIALAEKAGTLQGLTEEAKREKDRTLWRAWLTRYKDRLALECTTDGTVEEFQAARIAMMDNTNPRIVLRNFIAQNAIDYAEVGDFTEVQRVFRALRKPFDASVKYADLTGFDEAVEGGQANEPVQDEDAAKTHILGPSCSQTPKGRRIEYDAKPPEETSIRLLSFTGIQRLRFYLATHNAEDISYPAIMDITLIDIASLKKEYERNGAICIRGFLGEEWLAKAADAADAVFKEPSRLVQHSPYRSGNGELLVDYGNWKRQETIREVVFNSPIAKIVAELMASRTVTLYHDKICVKDPGDNQLAPFQEEMSNYPFSGQQACTVFVPVDPVPLETTPKFVLGSHLWGKSYYPSSFDPDYMTSGEIRTSECERVPDIRKMKDAMVTEWNLSPGDVVIYNQRTLMACNGNATGHKQRCFVTTWFGDDIRFVARLWPICPSITGKLKIGDHPSRDPETFPIVYPEQVAA
ncbi:Selenoprotein O [Hypsibius exemplaris]|uniref:Selenoprotein O n=1 Tax=Hypsibius exemplaris TaxID=2072580 RepID=A0A1W0X400_HYPEX|nr:Selenoprotein O [Hypsibius exemplaris]